MFNFVHHVRLLVHNADDMVTYLVAGAKLTNCK